MNRDLIAALCCAAISLLWPPAHGRAAVSPRPVVERNFQQLIKTNSCPSCDLAGAVLNRVDLSGANLEGANLAGARLYLANLAGANLKNANLQGAGLGGADLARADLRGANLTGAVLEGAYLKGALMDGVVTTRHTPDEDGVVGAGKTVFVGNASRSKHKPYTQEVVVTPRQDLAAMPAAGAPGRDRVPEKEGAAAAAGRETVAVGQGPKKLSPMADAVIPATVLPMKPGSDAGEVVQLAGVAKKKPVAAGSPAISPAPGEENPPAVAPAMDSGADDLGPPAADAVNGQTAGNGSSPAGPPAPGRGSVAVDGKDGHRNEAMAPADDTGQAVVAQPARPEPPPQVAKKAAGRAATGGKTVAGVKQASASASTAGPAAADGQPPAATPAKSAGPAAAAEGAAAAEKAVTRPADAMVPAAGKAVAGTAPAAVTEQRKARLKQLLDSNQCPECDLQGMDLSGRWLSDADLERADLRGANLEGTDLRDANLKAADLRKADLRKADLRGADLYMANLEGADLTGARMEGTLVDSADFTGAVGVPANQDGKGK